LRNNVRLVSKISYDSRKFLGPTILYDETRLAIGKQLGNFVLSGTDHNRRSARRKNSINFARYDQPFEALPHTHQVDIPGRQQLRKTGKRDRLLKTHIPHPFAPDLLLNLPAPGSITYE
jgi:hypothetical protein